MPGDIGERKRRRPRTAVPGHDDKLALRHVKSFEPPPKYHSGAINLRRGRIVRRKRSPEYLVAAPLLQRDLGPTRRYFP